MRHRIALIALASIPVLCSAQVPECFVGRWKSDEILTLADMRKHPEVTEKARDLFENSFFGHLVLIFGPRHVGGYLEGEQTREDLSFNRVDIVASGPNWLTLRSRVLGEEMLQKWACEDDRIYAIVTKWEFREYFSPLP